MNRLAAVLAVLVAVPALAQTNVTGTWTGTYNYSITIASCSKKTFTATGNASLALLQTANAVAGRLDVANFLNFNNSCTPGSVEATTTIDGTLSGDTISLTAPNDTNGTDWTGPVNGNAMTLHWKDASGGSGTITLSRPAGAAPAANVTGTWSGTYNFTDQCSSSAKVAYSGPMTVALTQSGANAGGVMTMQNVPLYDQTCKRIATLTQSMSVGGTVAASTLTGAVFDPAGLFEFPFSATLSATSMSGTVSGASSTNTTGTFTLTQSSGAQPASDLAGTYEGSYTETDNLVNVCLNASSLTFAGPAILNIAQAGSDVSGWLTLQQEETVQRDTFGNCFVVNAPDWVIPIYGTLANNTLTVNTPVAGSGSATIALTFSGKDVTLHLQDAQGDIVSLTATQTASGNTPPPPRQRRRAVKP